MKRQSKIENNTIDDYTVAVPVKSTEALTSFAEVAPQVVDSTPSESGSEAKLMNPYEPVNMGDVLSRKYLVSQFSWAPGDTFGTNLEKLDFPAALLAIPNIADKLAHFRWLKSDVTVEVRLNTSPLHIGSLVVSWLPHYGMSDAAGTPTANAVMRMQHNAHILSASSRQSITFDIARVGLRLADGAHNNPLSQIGRLWIDVLNPLKISGTGTPATVNVSVFASFKNPVVSGYGYTAPLPLNVKRRIKELQGLEPARKQSKQSGPQKEGTAKAKGGVISGLLEAASNFTPIIAASPFAEFAPFTAAAGLLAPFVKSLGFSKPLDPSKTDKVKISDFTEFPYGHGLVAGQKLALHPDATVGDTNSNSLKRYNIKELIAKPVLLYTGSFTSSSAALANLLRFPVQPSLAYKTSSTVYQPGMMAYISQMFAMWRGGIKFKIQFMTGQFTTARIRIAHIPNYEEAPSVEEYAGDAVSAVVDIRGDTEFEFTIPYINPMPYLPVMRVYGVADSLEEVLPTAMDSSYVTISVINPSTVSVVGGDSTIYMNIWMAAAEDMEFGHLGQWESKEYSLLPPAKKQSLETTFSKTFNPLIPAMASAEAGLVLPEKYSSIEAIMKRPAEMATPLVSGEEISLESFVLRLPPGAPMRAFAKLFLFWRGSLRLTNTWTMAAASPIRIGREYTSDLPPWTSDTSDISAIFDPTKSRSATVEFPWLNLSYLEHVWSANAALFPEDFGLTQIYSKNTSGDVQTQYASVGEDFVFGCPVAPPPITILASELGEKIKTKETLDLSVSSRNFVTLIKGDK